MVKKVSEEHGELYHYTGDVGLLGIVQSQQLWATNFAYLNDAEEHLGFFVRRFPRVLERAVRKAIKEVSKRPEAKRQIDADGGEDAVVAELVNEMRATFQDAAAKLNEPYIASFCGSKSVGADSDGLLSQWRGYGTQGGYAIGFRTGELEKMLQEEADAYHYQFGLFADVDYGADEEGNDHPERAELETALESSIVQSMLKDQGHADLAITLATLSCRYKHRGFREESEVRIVAMPTTDDVYRIAHAKGDRRPKKPIRFRPVNGVLVPYIELFGAVHDGKRRNLPISKIVVGPHSDKVKRQRAVQAMLKEAGVDASVTVSDIPYLGR